MAKRKTYFEQIPVETVKTIVERITSQPSAVSTAAKPVAIGSERKRALK